MSYTDGNDFKTFSFPLIFAYIFMLFTLKGSAIKMDRQEAASRLYKELEKCLYERVLNVITWLKLRQLQNCYM